MRRIASVVALLALAAPVAACGTSGASALGLGRAGAFGVLAKKQPPRPVIGSGELRMYVLPQATDAFMLQALAGAKKSIKLQVYLLTHPGVIDGLIAAHGRGVAVQVMMEEKPYNPGNPSMPLPTNRAAAKKFEAAGVPMKWTNPTFKYTHAKSVSVDDAVTYVSSANFTKSGLGVGGKGAREYVIEDRSPSDVAEFVAMFAADWSYTSYTPTDPDLVVSPVSSRTRIFELIKSAKRAVTIQVEVAGDPALDTLIAAKIREGVKVRALLADLGKLAGKESEGVRSNADVAQTWLRSGAEVRFQHVPHLHAKAILVDNTRFYTGSVNLTTNSMDNNRELGLLVQQADLVATMGRVLEADFAEALPVPAGGNAKKRGIEGAPGWDMPGLPI